MATTACVIGGRATGRCWAHRGGEINHAISAAQVPVWLVLQRGAEAHAATEARSAGQAAARVDAAARRTERALARHKRERQKVWEAANADTVAEAARRRRHYRPVGQLARRVVVAVGLDLVQAQGSPPTAYRGVEPVVYCDISRPEGQRWHPACVPDTFYAAVLAYTETM